MAKTARQEVLYRQYRPQTFKEVKGQGQVTDVLAKLTKKEKEKKNKEKNRK